MSEEKKPVGLKLIPDIPAEAVDTLKPLQDAAKADPFDPETFKIMVDDFIVAEHDISRIAVRKPRKEEFFRVHPDPKFVATAMLLEHEGEFFLVDSSVRSALVEELKPVELYICQSRMKALFVWPIRLPGENGRDNPWWVSARQIAQVARSVYVRCVPGSGDYVMKKISVEVPDPDWPKKSMRDLCELAFKTQHIRSLDHPVVKLLLGKI